MFHYLKSVTGEKVVASALSFCPRLDGIVGGQGLQDCGRGYNHRSVHR